VEYDSTYGDLQTILLRNNFMFSTIPLVSFSSTNKIHLFETRKYTFNLFLDHFLWLSSSWRWCWFEVRVRLKKNDNFRLYNSIDNTQAKKLCRLLTSIVCFSSSTDISFYTKLHLFSKVIRQKITHRTISTRKPCRE